jgi:NADPH:quinone reductase-like Zn-dependent oxidoreductase
LVVQQNHNGIPPQSKKREEGDKFKLASITDFDMASETHRALVVSSTDQPVSVQIMPKPQVTPGSAIVQILVAGVLPYAHAIYNGTRGALFPTPLVIGSSAVGRIIAVGADATLLKPDQLVIIDIFTRARDDRDSCILFGYRDGATSSSRKLIAGEWRDATYAEFAKVPLRTE